MDKETEEMNGILRRNDMEDSSPDSTAILKVLREEKMECIHYLCQCIFISSHN